MRRPSPIKQARRGTVVLHQSKPFEIIVTGHVRDVVVSATPEFTHSVIFGNPWFDRDSFYTRLKKVLYAAMPAECPLRFFK
jgi:hypothetical protein